MTTLRTARLTLRPITAADSDDPVILGWHTDPEGYRLMGEDPYTPQGARDALLAWAHAWSEHDIGYWIAEQDGAPVGIGGVRQLDFDGQTYLNLYYRLAPEVRGSGLAAEIASAATAHAAEYYPDLNLVARVAAGNEPSLRTIVRAGMVNLGPYRMPQDRLDQPDNILFQSAVVRTGIGGSYEEMVDLWGRVNAAGGAVGWEAGSDPAEVRTVLDGHLAADATVVRLHAPLDRTWDDPEQIGALIGFGIIQRDNWPSVRHRAWLYRVMTDPELRGRNFGRMLLAALHGVARRAGAELVSINYRGGTGLERFYGQLGYRESGRVPGGLRFSWGDVDDVEMTRRL